MDTKITEDGTWVFYPKVKKYETDLNNLIMFDKLIIDLPLVSRVKYGDDYCHGYTFRFSNDNVKCTVILPCIKSDEDLFSIHVFGLESKMVYSAFTPQEVYDILKQFF